MTMKPWLETSSVQARPGTTLRTRWPRALLGAAVAVLTVGLAASTPPDLAPESLGPQLPALSTPRDPVELADEILPVLLAPAALLSREDAVALEILKHTRTLPPSAALRVAQAVCEEASRLGYDPFLLVALVHVESDYNHLAVSYAGAEGLMQLMPATASYTAERNGLAWPDGNSFDPVLNVRLGTRYLAQLHREFGRMDYALTAYNRGPSATHFIVRQHGSLPRAIADFYSNKVLERCAELSRAYQRLPLDV